MCVCMGILSSLLMKHQNENNKNSLKKLFRIFVVVVLSPSPLMFSHFVLRSHRHRCFFLSFRLLYSTFAYLSLSACCFVDESKSFVVTQEDTRNWKDNRKRSSSTRQWRKQTGKARAAKKLAHFVYSWISDINKTSKNNAQWNGAYKYSSGDREKEKIKTDFLILQIRVLASSYVARSYIILHLHHHLQSEKEHFFFLFFERRNFFTSTCYILSFSNHFKWFFFFRVGCTRSVCVRLCSFYFNFHQIHILYFAMHTSTKYIYMTRSIYNSVLFSLPSRAAKFFFCPKTRRKIKIEIISRW